MKQSRRAFLGAGAAAASGALLGRAQADEPKEPPKPGALRCLDYGQSFVCHPGPGNAVRFWIESRTTLFDDKAGVAAEFYQCGSCKSENTFAERDLLKKDNYDFMPIEGDGYLLIFRRPAGLSSNYRQLVKTELKTWGKP